MVDLDKLNAMLNGALDSETAESLGSWIDEQIETDRALGIIRDTESGGFGMYKQYSRNTLLDKSTIEEGVSEFISYNKVSISGNYDSKVSDNTNYAA